MGQSVEFKSGIEFAVELQFDEGAHELIRGLRRGEEAHAVALSQARGGAKDLRRVSLVRIVGEQRTTLLGIDVLQYRQSSKLRAAPPGPMLTADD